MPRSFPCFQWLNLCLDLVSLVGETWLGQTFYALDHMTVSANCKVRRIFSMRSPLSNDAGGNSELQFQVVFYVLGIVLFFWR